MLKTIDRFFYLLTLQNWGFPWHLILCWGAVSLGQIWFHLGVVIWVVAVVSILYEVYQVLQYKRKAAYSECDYIRDMWQDIIANAIGILLGVFL